MWRVDGFKTIEEAKAFKKENGGIVLWRKLTPTGRKSNICKEYELAMRATGLDMEKLPYIVERRI